MSQSATLTANKTARGADVFVVAVVQAFESAEGAYHVTYQTSCHVPYHVPYHVPEQAL